MSVLEDFLTVEDAAKMLSVDRTRVTLLCRQGRFPGAMKASGVWLIPRSSVENHKRLPPGAKPKTPTRADDAALIEAALGGGAKERRRRG